MEQRTPAHLYGIVGFPVKHSLSPLMHNAAFAHLGIDAQYRLFEKTPQELEPFFRSLQDEGVRGLNVTVPYKESVAPFLARVSADARLIGAVNTVVVGEDGLSGHNTDAAGFLRHLREDVRFDPRGKNAAVIGAGGASRAITVSLCQSGIKELFLYDVDRGKAERLAAQARQHFPSVALVAANTIEEARVPECALLVNTTPLGMKSLDPLPVPEELLPEQGLVYDLVYVPAQTKLLQAARRRRLLAVNGIGMLLYQGMLAFQLWTGREAPTEVMRRALAAG